jgi:RNA polymerase sigma-70 factor (ECF subfamily)
MRPEVEQAVTALAAGEKDAAAKSLALLQQTIFSFSMKICGHREDAEDTMQETLLQAMKKLASFRSAKALTVWLYKVAKSRCLMSRRTSKFAPKEKLSLEVLMPSAEELERLTAAEPNPERSALGRESAEQVQKAILKLPPEYRLVLVLHDMEELSTEEIASVMRLREGTVRVRLHRARVFVRNELAQIQGAKLPARRKLEPRPSRCRKLFAQLSGYLDEQLDDVMCNQVEQHLENCSPCQAFLQSLERTVERLRHHSAGSMDPEKMAQIRASLIAQYRQALGNRSLEPEHSSSPGTQLLP